MEPIEAQQRSRGNGLCECVLAALSLYSAGLIGNVYAAEQPQDTAARHDAQVQKAVREQIAAPSFPAPFMLTAPSTGSPAFSATEFRPRKPGPSALADSRGTGALIDAPMLADTSIARELSEAKTQDRLRLLTLWQSRASSLSLQTGKHGAPSLQWSTPWMHRDLQSRGVFDRLLSAAPGGFGSLVRGGNPRPAAATTPAKSAEFGASIAGR